MSTSMNCEQCKPRLFDIVDGTCATSEQLEINQHLDTCDDCSNTLAELWQVAAMASRWQEKPVPAWNRRGHFFEPRSWFPAIQVASACASVFVMVLVLGEVEVSTSDGLRVRFGESYALETSVDTKLAALKEQQEGQLRNSVDRLTNQQIASNQLLLKTTLAATRSERREDLSNLLVLLEETQDQRYQQTEASLRYLVDTQIEDRRNIKQLGRAIRLVASDGGTL